MHTKKSAFSLRAMNYGAKNEGPFEGRAANNVVKGEWKECGGKSGLSGMA